VADIRESWEAVGQELAGLGLKLKMHFEQAAKEGRPVEEDVVKESLHKVGEAVEQTFTALGAASRDEAVLEDIKTAGRSMLDALDATFSELGDRFRSAVKTTEESAGPETIPVTDGSPEPPSSPPTDPVEPPPTEPPAEPPTEWPTATPTEPPTEPLEPPPTEPVEPPATEPPTEWPTEMPMSDPEADR
jgi:hypothetical protein